MAEQETPIADYALIGDGRSAALISRDGSLDWLCWPCFDSPSLFAALLDPDRGGRFRIRPTGSFRAARRYLPDTNVLETVFSCQSGSVALRDLMPVAAETERRSVPEPEHEILREVEALEGEVELDVLYAPRPDYGRVAPHLFDRGPFGIWCETGRGVLVMRDELGSRLSPDKQTASGVVRLRAGERRHLSLAYGREAPMVVPLLGEAARSRVEQTVRWWRDWVDGCRYRGPYRNAVVRSSLALKLLAFAPSGALVAAPTTSLPERSGGDKNWDYRFCWLRDAAFTVRCFFGLGYDAEAESFLDWLLHATRLTRPQLQVVYDVFGEARLPERTLDHLAGYSNALPVRIGNDAHRQFQLDVYGEVADAAAIAATQGVRFDREAIQMLNGLGRTVCARWREPDAGIWESRSRHIHYTHSKVLCWVALDRLVRLHEKYGFALDGGRFRAEREAIRAEIEARGFSPGLGTYTRRFDGDDLDASLLLLPLYGYIDAAHPRMRATTDHVLATLGRGPLVYRYPAIDDQGQSTGEGTFGACAFWAVEARARGGDIPGAQDTFEHLLNYANDVGLFAEEIAADSGQALGNFPQAFTHIGLIGAALTLAECAGNGAPGTAGAYS